MVLADKPMSAACFNHVSRRWFRSAATEKHLTMSASLLSTARLIDLGMTRFKPAHFGVAALLLAAVATIWMVRGLHGGERSTVAGDMTSSIDAAPLQLGPSGFAIPRFLTLKSGKVNVRTGPSSDHDVAWVFQRKGMPVEVTAEFENWRKIRDSEGAEGWILQQMLSGRRFALAPEWNKHKAVALHDAESGASATLAMLMPGAIAQIKSCTGEWCYVTTDHYEGYAVQAELWGVYPGEVVD
jgi:SH3-like domain-containing protein